MKTRFLLLALFAAINIYAQPYMWWTKSYDSPMAGSQDTSVSITIDNAANLYVAGHVDGFNTGSDIVLLKLNSATGDTIWVKRYTGPGANEDKPLALTSDSSGFIYLTGFSFQPSRDIITIKFDGAGNIVWLRTYNGSNNGGDYGFAIKTDPAGNVYVTGRSDVNDLQHFTTIKYNSAGVQQWVSVYDGPLSRSFDQPAAIDIDNSGNVYVSGYTTVLQNFSTADFLTLKYNNNGTLQWAKRYNGTANGEDAAVDVIVLGNDVFVTGRSDSLSENYNYCTIKYNASTGDSIACVFYGGPPVRQIDNPVDMTTDNMGYLYVTGYSMGTTNTYDIATVKYNLNLQQMWASRYEGSGTDVACKIVFHHSFLYVAGSSTLTNGSDFITIKYDLSGSQVWTARFNAQGNGNDHCASIVLDQSDNLYMAGYGIVTGNEDDIFVVRFSANPVGIQTVSGNIPGSYKLYQNYPNPFNPSTNIKIDIPAGAESNTKLIIYDVLGRQIAEVINQKLSPGSYLVNWDASAFSNGVYFYKLFSGNFTSTNKMILVK